MMKYISLSLVSVMLCACASHERAGSHYDPEYYTKLRQETEVKTPLAKSDNIVKTYHSALGSLCNQYLLPQGDETLVCNDGQSEKQMRILQ